MTISYPEWLYLVPVAIWLIAGLITFYKSDESAGNRFVLAIYATVAVPVIGAILFFVGLVIIPIGAFLFSPLMKLFDLFF